MTGKPAGGHPGLLQESPKRSALSTATEGQGAVLALPLCLEGLVFSPLAAR